MNQQQQQKLLEEVGFGNPDLAGELLQQNLKGTEFEGVIQNGSSLFWVIFNKVFTSLYAYQQSAVQAFLPQLFVNSATGQWLEQHALDFDLHRRQPKKAQYQLSLHKDAPNSFISIAEGDVFFITAADPRRYKSKTAVSDNQNSVVKIVVEAEETGKNYNVIANRIVQALAGLPLRTTNPITHPAVPEVYGDDIETDAQLKTRLINRIAARIKTGSNEYYRSIILSVAGVGNAKIANVNPANGEVSYAIVGISGAASPEVVADVQTLVDTEKQPTDIVKIIAAQPQPLSLNIKIEGAYIEAQIIKSVERFFQNLPPANKFESSELSNVLYGEFVNIHSVRITPQYQAAGPNFFVPTITFSEFK